MRRTGILDVAKSKFLSINCIGADIIGDPILIPDLIELMTHRDVTWVAGDAFSMITGIDIEYSLM